MTQGILIQPVTTRLDIATVNRLKSTAKYRGISQTHLVREAIEEYLEKHKPAQIPIASQNTWNP